MNELKLITCVGVDRELGLLPHFIDHYLALGIEPRNVFVILNGDDPASAGFEAARAVLAGRGVASGIAWVAPYTSDSMWAKRRELQAEVARADDWVVSADVDELHEYPGALAEVLARCAAIGANVVQGVFIDRVAADGSLAEVRDAPAIEAQFPLRTDAIGALGGSGRHHDRYGTVKLMAMRGDVMPSRGGHHPLGGQPGLRFLQGAPLGAFSVLDEPERRFGWPFRVHHYKWTSDLVPGLHKRLATPGVSEAGREYGTKLLERLEAHGGLPLAELPIDALDPAERALRARRDWRRRMAAGRLRAALRHRWSRLRQRLSPSASAA